MHNRSHWSKSSCRLDWWQPTKEWTSSLIATYYELKAFFLIVSNLAACFFLKKWAYPGLFSSIIVLFSLQFQWQLAFSFILFSHSVWPDLGKFCHFGKILQVFGVFWAVYFLFGKMLSLLWQICYIIGHIALIPIPLFHLRQFRSLIL